MIDYEVLEGKGSSSIAVTLDQQTRYLLYELAISLSQAHTEGSAFYVPIMDGTATERPLNSSEAAVATEIIERLFVQLGG